MEVKIILCPKCRKPNAPGVTTCRSCGIRLCCQCNSAMPPQLGVCPQCGWWDPDWKPLLRNTNEDTRAPKPGRVFTKKLDFQCAQCGANVAHDAEKCTLCGYVGHMHLRDKQDRSSMATAATAPVQNNSINAKRSASMTSKPRSAAIRSKGIISTGSRSSTNISSGKKSFNSKNRETTDKAKLWGYETGGRKFPLWLFLAIAASAIILITLAISLFLSL